MIFKAIPKLIAAIGPISKDQSGMGYKFRGIDQVYNALMPLLAKEKVFTVPTVLEVTTEDRKSSKGNNLIYRILKIRYDFYAEDGSSVSAVVVGEAMDSGDKACNKAMSVAHKYALFQALCIATSEIEDTDQAGKSTLDPTEKYEGTSKQKEILMRAFIDNSVNDNQKMRSIANMMIGQPLGKMNEVIKANA